MTTPITLQNGPDAYQTRDGREVSLLTVEGRNPMFPVVGECKSLDGSWGIVRWDSFGQLVGNYQTRADLIPKPVRHKREVWVNIYACGEYGHLCVSKERADKEAGTHRIACIKVELDFQEGEGIA